MHTSRRLVSRAFASLLFLAATVEAGEDRWTPIGIGEGLVHALAVDPDGVLYAAADLGGVYRSTDAARTWQWRGAVTVNLDVWTDVVVAPNDRQRLYATTVPSQITSGGIYTSGDGGLHWQELFRRRSGFNSVAVSANGTVLAASQDAQVYRSADGGRTWSSVLQPESGDPNNPLQLAFDPLAPATAYLGGREALWRSDDSGATWRRIGTWPDGEAVDNVRAFAFPGTRPGVFYALMRSSLYRTEDGGLTWSGGAVLPGGYADIAVDPSDPDTVYAVGSELFVSHDGGDTAIQLPRPPTGPFPRFLAIVVSPADPETLFISVDALGVIVSTDGGEHWTLHQQQGLSANRAFPGDFVAAPSGRLYHAPYRTGLFFRSLDRGASWSPLAPLPNGFVTELAEEAGAPDRLWAATIGQLYQSTDGGASWMPSSLTPSIDHVASPARGVVLAGGCGLWRTADSGRTWAPVLPCFSGRDEDQKLLLVHRLGVPPGWPGAVWAEVEIRYSVNGQKFQVLFSQDSGRTWRTLTQSTTISSFGLRTVAASRRVIYLNRVTALLRSDDAGASWTPLPFPGRILSLAVDAADPDIVYAATRNQGVLRSTDGGRTWNPVNAGLARLGRLWVQDVLADPAVPSVAYTFPVKGGIFQARFTD